MNINEAVDTLIDLQKSTIGYLVDSIGYKTAIAEILEELPNTGGVGTEYMEAEK